MIRSTKSRHDSLLPVPQTAVKEWLTDDDMSPLGRALMDIASDIQLSVGPAFDEQAVERELTARRGGYSAGDD